MLLFIYTNGSTYIIYFKYYKYITYCNRDLFYINNVLYDYCNTKVINIRKIIIATVRG